MKYPILSQQTPAVDTEPAFLQENVNRDEIENKQRLQRTRVGNQITAERILNNY